LGRRRNLIQATAGKAVGWPARDGGTSEHKALFFHSREPQSFF
jgi:hypothetical protein